MTDLERLLTDLREVAELVKWAETEAFVPGRIDPMTPTGRGNPLPGPDGDVVPGPRWDTGVGSHGCRTALEKAAINMRTVAKRFALSVRVTAEPVQLVKTVEGYVRFVETFGRYRTPRELADAADAAFSARRTLEAALNPPSPVVEAVGEPVCRICEIRPKAEKAGGRCKTCQVWKNRNGAERPRSLDDAVVKDALEAQARRLGRGEGHGDESLSCTGAPR